MFKVGITGGIGSGKSTVCAILEKKGMPIFYADQEAQIILGSDQDVRRRVVDLLGESAYNDQGFDRKWVGSIVFNDAKKLEGLNAIMRPAVRDRFNAWAASQNKDMVGMEAAIMIESGGHKTMDHIIVVTAPMDVRIARAMKRDNATEKQIKSRIDAQMSEDELLEYADSLIVNSGDVDRLREQVDMVHLHLHEIAGTQG